MRRPLDEAQATAVNKLNTPTGAAAEGFYCVPQAPRFAPLQRRSRIELQKPRRRLDLKASYAQQQIILCVPCFAS